MLLAAYCYSALFVCVCVPVRWTHWQALQNGSINRDVVL